MEGRVEPSRITLARRLLGWTKARLAKEGEVSVGAVTLWELGSRDATAKIDMLSDKLKQPKGFFLEAEVPITLDSAVSFRKRSDAKRELRDSAAAAIDLASGVLTPAVYNVFGRLPEVNVPNMAGMAPEAAAIALRREWGLNDNPLRSTVDQLEAKGVRVYWVDSGSPALSAFCKWVDREPYVILNSAKHDGCRSRYDACHELCHLVCHQGIDFDTADPRKYEREADAFASAFLMPKESFLEDAPRTFDKDRLLSLKPVWKVSVQAMVRRLYDLKVFSDWQYEYAFRMMSAWGWRRNPEPCAGPMETSTIHWRLCDKLEESDMAPRTFIESLPLRWETAAMMMPALQVRQYQFNIGGLFEEGSPLRMEGSREALPYDD